jgi:3-hydroxybutyryl-CoA dehydratase
LNGLAVGATASVARAFSENDLLEYAALTCSEAGGDRAIPNGLIGAMFSQLLGTKLPGRGTNWLKQRMSFVAPASVDETLIATVRVVRIRSDKGLVNLSTICTTSAGRLVAEGEALVLCKEMV